jgi:hypothetical protein
MVGLEQRQLDPVADAATTYKLMNAIWWYIHLGIHYIPTKNIHLVPFFGS